MVDRNKAVEQEKASEARLLISIRAASRPSGVGQVDFTFLCDWLTPRTLEAFKMAIARHARGYSAVQPIYSVRKVLQFWRELGRAKGWPEPNSKMCGQTLTSQISELRGEFYAERTRRGCALVTASGEWSQFLRFLPDLVASRAICSIEASNASFAAPRTALVIAKREAAANSVRQMKNAPVSLNRTKNSFNENLLEPISIIDGSEAYLDKYQKQLGQTIGTILRCAVEDFEGFEHARLEGLYQTSLVKREEITALRALPPNKSSWVAWRRYVDKNHADALRLALGVVTHEMGGVPRSRGRLNVETRLREDVEGSAGSWDLVACYGKNNLLPYLGLMTSKVAAVCMVILIIEHPILNPYSLYTAKVERDRSGGSYITSDGLSDNNGVRLSVEKLRAGMEKSTPLSPLAQRVLARVFEWTEPLRRIMQREGREAHANHLWVGLSGVDYRIKAFGAGAILNALGIRDRPPTTSNKKLRTRVERFTDRHPELAPWKGRITFKTLRMSSGVLKFLEADGDLAEAARIFGHRAVDTTLGHYVPNGLRLAMFERQVRRHQNRLIVEALPDPKKLIQISDFRSIEDLHQFLSSIEPLKAVGAVDRQSGVSQKADSGLILYKDPSALAVAMIYRDLLQTASEKFLDRPDLRTGIKPRFWRDFIDRITEPLPPAMADLSDLLHAASARKRTLAKTIRLPEVA